MSSRHFPISQGEIYHVFNRSVGGQPIFLDKNDYCRAFEVINFYSFHKPNFRFSHFNRLRQDDRNKVLLEMETKHVKQIDLLSYCLMPNHFHFLIKECINSGITDFFRFFQDSYAKFFNAKRNRHGALFQAIFKAVRIESDEQFLHVCRYIHLNPFTSFIIKSIDELENYQWSSFPDYIGKRRKKLLEVNTRPILDCFTSLERFKSFTFDQSDYQRQLKELEYFTLEKD